MKDVSIVVPTFNEGPNIAPLVERLTSALHGRDIEIIIVDDSSDDTPLIAAAVAQSAAVPVRVIHRESAAGGLGGAVVEGLRAAQSDFCVVMDGDLQHPPEKVPEIVERLTAGDVDVVVASRYIDGGDADGLAGRVRIAVSRASTLITKAMFPKRLVSVSDPMTGFFGVDRRAIRLETLRPRGFKILLELLARTSLRIAEVPFVFADRHGGESKASFRQGIHFLAQLAMLRFGKMSLFAAVGALGTIINLAIMWVLTELGSPYIVAAIVGAEVTIVGNFLLQERYVFNDMRSDAAAAKVRFFRSFLFNNAEALVRLPVLAFLVETWHIQSVLAAAITLAVAFVVRFVYHALYVYAPGPAAKKKRAARTPSSADAPSAHADAEIRNAVVDP